MKNFIRYACVLGTLGSLFFACTSKKGDLHPQTSTQNLNLPDTVSYSKDIQPLITTYCYGQGFESCHKDGTAQNQMMDYDHVQFEITAFHLYDRVINHNPSAMPPSNSSKGPLPAREFALLKKWLDSGYPNN